MSGQAMSVQASGWTVLVVDDHDGFRSAARALLESQGLVVVGEASDGATALNAAARLVPDLVLLDVQLPDIDGFEVARRLAAGGAETPVVVLVSTRGASSYRRRLAENPTLAFVSKTDLTGPALDALLVGRLGRAATGEGA